MPLRPDDLCSVVVPAAPAPCRAAGAELRTPIGAFLLARLELQGWTPAPSAECRTRLRRVKFDRTGLSPTLEEIVAVPADDKPNVFEQLIDRPLLARTVENTGRKIGEAWSALPNRTVMKSMGNIRTCGVGAIMSFAVFAPTRRYRKGDVVAGFILFTFRAQVELPETSH